MCDKDKCQSAQNSDIFCPNVKQKHMDELKFLALLSKTAIYSHTRNTEPVLGKIILESINKHKSSVQGLEMFSL